MFLDHSHIRRLAKAAAAENDDDWWKYGRFIRHSRGHRNHIHVRVGEGPGPAGCSLDARPELESEEDNGEGDGVGESPLDRMPSGGDDGDTDSMPKLIKAETSHPGKALKTQQ